MATERVEAAKKMLEEAITHLQSTEDWQRFLAGTRSFHSYSFNNKMLIWIQREDATKVKGYRAWQDLGRQVRKGSEAIYILAPRPYKKTNEDGDEEQRMTFRAIPVFAYEDTDPIEGHPHPWEPATRKPVVGDEEAANVLLEDLYAFASQKAWAVAISHKQTSAQGSFTPENRSIWLQSDLSTLERVRVLTHEIGHALTYDAMKADNAGAYDYSLGEAVAESIAYTVCGEFGIDTTEASSQYIALWEGDRFRQAASWVSTAVGEIMGWLETTGREVSDDLEEVA